MTPEFHLRDIVTYEGDKSDLWGTRGIVMGRTYSSRPAYDIALAGGVRLSDVPGDHLQLVKGAPR